jgi:hypothetical protein
MDPSQGVEPGKKIFVPNAPAPVVNEHIIQPLAGNEEPDTGDAGGDGGSPIGNAPSIIDNLQFCRIDALEARKMGRVGSRQDPAGAARPTLEWDRTAIWQLRSRTPTQGPPGGPSGTRTASSSIAQGQQGVPADLHHCAVSRFPG